MKKIVFLVLCASVIAIARPNHEPMTFEGFDLNADGVITAQEFDDAKTARMTKMAEQGKQLRNAGNSLMFTDVDKDGDGKATKEEFTAAQQARMQEQMQKRQQMQGQGKGKNQGWN